MNLILHFLSNYSVQVFFCRGIISFLQIHSLTVHPSVSTDSAVLWCWAVSVSIFTEVTDVSSEFVGFKNLEIDIYGLTVLRCKEISHSFANIVIKFFFPIWIDYEMNSPRGEKTSRIMFLFFPLKLI